MKYVFDRVGRTLEYEGQAFVCANFLPHTRADGTATELAVVEAECAKCRSAFRFTVPVSGSAFHPNRNCDRHKRRRK